MNETVPTVFLASQSPRRSQLLDQIGVAHQLLLPDAQADISEDTEALELEQPGERPQDYVVRVTQLKLQAARARAQRRGLDPQALILCADTTVEADGCILGKPQDPVHAAAMLQMLSGAEHRVWTAVAICRGERVEAALSESVVRFAALTPLHIQRYIDSGQWQGKAGGYGIQGLAARFVQHISGSYSGIMGLPLFETAQLLERLGGMHENNQSA